MPQKTLGITILSIGLAISDNLLSGPFPLEYEGNSFSGSIPPSFSSLKSLKELHLSSNNLSSRIPEYLEKLSFLESLNLS
ncbi:hypothetical protein Ddye_023043 [Dipteronia dyeriana]|uniref:Uncharacterized protein n=1 Tax=Dipteronia dyeriana TaxID=168575 RepID=A0AAD9WT07_9ROSI|nr:hypothetical protein Ddye_023043 [Dipteronia dyeriana]